MERKIKAGFLALVLAASSALHAEVLFKAETAEAARIQPLASSTESDADSLLAELIAIVWSLSNLSVTFDTYPYANGKYLMFNGLSSSDSYAASTDRSWRGEIETSAFVFPGKVWGNESRLEGILWKFIGPVFENTIYYPTGKWKDNTDFDPLSLSTAADIFDADRSYTGNIRLGGQFSLWYTNPLSAALFMEWSKWYGAMDIGGVAFGLIVKSYPFDPILVEWRGTVQGLNEKYEVDDIYESHLEVGAMVAPRIEVYGAWKYTHNPLLSIKGHGAALGAKVHW